MKVFVCICVWAQSSAHESLVLQIFNLQIWWTEWNSGNKCEIGNFKESIHHAWSRWMFVSLDFFPDFLWWPQEKSCMCIWLTRGTKTHLHTHVHTNRNKVHVKGSTHFLKTIWSLNTDSIYSIFRSSKNLNYLRNINNFLLTPCFCIIKP